MYATPKHQSSPSPPANLLPETAPLSGETLLSLREACREVPDREGKKFNLSTIYRWVNKGIRGIRLECVQLGGQRMTSREALGRFFTRLTEQAGLQADAGHCGLRTPAQRRRAHKRADDELSQAGW